MKKYENKNLGITLVALVITIVILLILAGISISALTNTGLFKKAKEAKEKTREAEENQTKTLSEYETALDQYGDNTLVSKFNNGKIKVGDYISYEPDVVTGIDEKYKTLISNLKTYSGATENTESTLVQDELKWRVLDVKDRQVRLISATPTKSTIALNGYNGYNNAVKLLDDVCSTLYNNSKLASTVQNLKIEDLQDKMVEKDYTKFSSDYGNNHTIAGNKYYTDILQKEKEQTVNTLGTELGISEQKELTKQTEKKQADNLNIKSTFWTKYTDKNDFNSSKYYELFINNEGFYSIYWLSSRCVNYDTSYGAGFNVFDVLSGNIYANRLGDSNGYERSDNFTYRPIITLKADVQLDTIKSGDGSTAEQAYVIK